MPRFPIKTTAPAVATSCEEEHQLPVLAFVILWSASQPHRVGEVALLPYLERLFVGRGAEEIDEFARFAQRRPGARLADDPFEDLLTGDSISGRQLVVCATPDAIEVESIGRCVMRINGVETKTGRLKPGDTLMLKGELLLMCVRRLAELPAPRAGTFIPAFGEPDAGGIIGESPAAWALRVAIADAAATEDYLLIQGETGSGKELTAKAIHAGSGRAKRAFVAHNSAAFTATLLENQLFGNVAGYPNGMPENKGLVIRADGGTLFLDEIGDLRLDAQTHLLRVMDRQGECQVQGAPGSRRVDVRFIGATNLDDTAFRSDFRARLPAHLRVPPLRERPEDIPLLVRHWLLRRPEDDKDALRFIYSGPSGRPEARVSGRLIEYLVKQPFPRNVRELEAMLIAASGPGSGDTVSMPSGGLANASAPPPAKEADEGQREGAAEEEQGERDAESLTQEEIVACLQQQGGKVARAARVLRVGRSALHRRMKKLKING
jgi:two-component system nitrogen regulation response regulator GlnG/two-component system response regulator HydG